MLVDPCLALFPIVIFNVMSSHNPFDIVQLFCLFAHFPSSYTHTHTHTHNSIIVHCLGSVELCICKLYILCYMYMYTHTVVECNTCGHLSMEHYSMYTCTCNTHTLYTNILLGVSVCVHVCMCVCIPFLFPCNCVKECVLFCLNIIMYIPLNIMLHLMWFINIEGVSFMSSA